eukprot:TRINITY_DN11355_c0_g1_i1.p1 TRINITY_DN11355_c0_g1~~TRINITY_DN11355_c0_g1_i1.p1  ORF type:complete len:168 (+),score=57.41 TRINITY_DN11355_c0_g1_i1:170-673(+)
MRTGIVLFAAAVVLILAMQSQSEAAELSIEEYSGESFFLSEAAHLNYMGEWEEDAGSLYRATDEIFIDSITFGFSGLGYVKMRSEDSIKVAKYDGKAIQLEAHVTDYRVQSVMLLVNGVQTAILNQKPFQVSVEANKGLLQVIAIPYSEQHATGQVGSPTEASVIIN